MDFSCPHCKGGLGTPPTAGRFRCCHCRKTFDYNPTMMARSGLEGWQWIVIGLLVLLLAAVGYIAWIAYMIAF